MSGILPNTTPEDDEGLFLATMVWIHGGGFGIGSGVDDVHNGATLAKEQNVIVVSLNYHLGALGFLSQDESGYSGMNSLYDQIVVFEWVQSYQSSFGGDGDSVTVFGERAGGKVCMSLVSPLAQG
jgi:para-nitrobenzyl esterase